MHVAKELPADLGKLVDKQSSFDRRLQVQKLFTVQILCIGTDRSHQTV